MHTEQGNRDSRIFDFEWVRCVRLRYSVIESFAYVSQQFLLRASRERARYSSGGARSMYSRRVAKRFCMRMHVEFTWYIVTERQKPGQSDSGRWLRASTGASLGPTLGCNSQPDYALPCQRRTDIFIYLICDPSKCSLGLYKYFFSHFLHTSA